MRPLRGPHNRLTCEAPADKKTSLLVGAAKNFSAKGEPLHSLGLAKSVGIALLFEGPSPSGSYVRPQPFHERRPDMVDPRSLPVALAWAQGVLAVKPWHEMPKRIQAELDYSHNGWYTLRAYTSVKTVRYLVSLDVKRQAVFQTIWCCRFDLLARHPTFEFASMVRQFRDIPTFKPKVQKKVVRKANYLPPPAPLPDPSFTGFEHEGRPISEEEYLRITAELEASW